MTNDDGKRCLVEIPDLELLRDVKTRWDSTFQMLERLRQFRLVGLSHISDVRDKLNVLHRPSICILRPILWSMQATAYWLRIGTS